MKKSSKRVLSMVLIISLLLAMVQMICAETIVDVDTFLEQKGVPAHIIGELSDAQKEFICENLRDNSTYAMYEKQTGVLPTLENGAQTYADIIGEGEIELSVVSFETKIDGVSGYSIFPSFDWNSVVKVRNDSFSMALYPGWEVVPGECSFRLALRNIEGTIAQSTTINPATSTSSGYQFLIPSSTGAVQGDYEGHAYLFAEKTNSSANTRISLHYVDDTSWLFNTSYGISIGPASISITGTQSNLRYCSQNMAFA